ncbi:hypothetical protein LXL04_033838 [Taraxacum kok-saghyz]
MQKKKVAYMQKFKKNRFFWKNNLRPGLYLSDFSPPEVGFSKKLTVWEFSGDESKSGEEEVGIQRTPRFVAAYRDRGRANLLTSAGDGRMVVHGGGRRNQPRVLHISGDVGAVASDGSRQPRCLGWTRATISPPPIGIAGGADREGELNAGEGKSDLPGPPRYSTSALRRASAVARHLLRQACQVVPDAGSPESPLVPVIGISICFSRHIMYGILISKAGETNFHNR